MLAACILVAENDPVIAKELMWQLDGVCRSVRLAHSVEELKLSIPFLHVDAVVADLETVALEEISAIARALHVPVICTHRIPDEKMWSEVLDAGALDMYPSSDVKGIVNSLLRNIEAAHAKAA